MIVKDGPMRAIVGIREAQSLGVSNETIRQWHPNRVPPDILIIFCRSIAVFHEDSTNTKFLLKLENELKERRKK